MEIIKNYIRKGQIDNAVKRLESYAKSIGADEDVLSDILVLQNNISTLKRQEKRRKIRGDDLRDAITGYTFDLMDIIKEIESDTKLIEDIKITTTNESAAVEDSKTTDSSSMQNINNININIDISNHITNEIKMEIQNLTGDFERLKNELACENIASDETIKEVESMSETLKEMEEVSDKSQLPIYLEKVKNFISKIENKNENISKAICLAKDGANTVKKIITNYNNIAKWIGLPTVPPIFG